jgi:hypothetical protein
MAKKLARKIAKALSKGEDLILTDQDDLPAAIVVPYEHWQTLNKALDYFQALASVAEEMTPDSPEHLVVDTAADALLDWGATDMSPEEKQDFEAWWKQKHAQPSGLQAQQQKLTESHPSIPWHEDHKA